MRKVFINKYNTKIELIEVDKLENVLFKINKTYKYTSLDNFNNLIKANDYKEVRNA